MSNIPAPAGIQPPTVISSASHSLELQWDPPTQPNGLIRSFDLFRDSELIFSGPGNVTRTLVVGLAPFTSYFFFIQACTAVGCENSSVIVFRTLPDSPSGLAAPNLTVLSPSSIEAVWQPPSEPNGMLLYYELLILFGPGFSQNRTFTVRLNTSTTVTGLTPSTLYSVQLFAYNAGGSTSSPVVSIQTLEDIPDGLSPPTINVINATTLLILWQEPAQPNGVITEYILLQNGVQIFSGLMLSYQAVGLQPFSVYTYSIMACTMRGCGTSPPSSSQTPEAIAEGYVEPTLTETSAEYVRLTINPVSVPNGIVTYVLMITGEFQAPDVFNTIVGSQTVYNSSNVGSVIVRDLLPFSSYSFQLRIVNSAGVLVGDPFTVQTAASCKFICICMLIIFLYTYIHTL